MRVFVIVFMAALAGGAWPGRAADVDWSALCNRGAAAAVTDLEVGGGDEESEDEPPFLRPAGIAVAGDGSFYVLDGDGFVVHFSADGSERNRFARAGEGPGELRDPFGIDVDEQGRVVVFDAGNRRFSFFRADGTLITTRPHPHVVTRFACSRGRIVLEDEPVEMSRPGAKQLHRLVVCDADLGHPVVVDSLRAMKFQVLVRDGGAMSVSTPFYTELAFCVLDDGSLVYAATDRYELKVLGPDLRPRSTLRRDIPPTPISDRDREEYYDSFAQSGEAVIAWMKRDIVWPKHQPFIDRLYAAGNTVLVSGPGDPRRKEDTPAIDVFQGDRMVGTLAVENFRMTDFSGARFYRILYRDDRLPAVARFRLE
jgi:hypothetical protein